MPKPPVKKGLTTDQQLSVDRGETPQGRYSIVDALEALANRRKVRTPDTSSIVPPTDMVQQPTDSSTMQLLLARIAEALNSRRQPVGDNPLVRKRTNVSILPR